MDFFQRQDQARKSTKLLVCYFVAAVAMLILTIYVVALLVFGGVKSRQHRNYDEGGPAPVSLWDPQIFFGVAVGTLAIIGLGSAWKTAELGGGGKAVAESLGGRLVQPNTIDLDERKLLNVVEEMAIAAGLPVPQVYVMDDEQAINAFAAGFAPSDAVISVTRGCIQSLSRDELQGVIGHEFSHILNGDMRLNLRLMGIIFGIICIATIGRILLRVRSSGKNSNPLPLFGLALLIIGAIGVFFGRLIQAAVSRQREFLADASAVQFTRNPVGLSGALQKIGQFSSGSRLESAHAADACHMFFGNGVREPFFGLLATHPPIPARIKAIDPSWDGTYPKLNPEQLETVRKAAIGDLRSSPLPGILGTIGVVLGSQETTGVKPPPIPTTAVLPNLGQPTALHLRYAQQLRESLPDGIKSAAREPVGATALIYSLLLSADASRRATQLKELARRVTPAIQEKIAALAPDVAEVAQQARLPLVNLAITGLRSMSPSEFKEFTQTLKWLIESDEQVELFEFVLQKIVARHLEPQFGQVRQTVVQYYSIKPLVPDCALLLSALANVGSDTPAEIQKAFVKGAPYLRAVGMSLPLLPRTECGLDQIDAALNRLAQAVPQIKKNLLEASINVVGADGVIQEREAELLRAVADTLDCPIPPFVTTE